MAAETNLCFSNDIQFSRTDGIINHWIDVLVSMADHQSSILYKRVNSFFALKHYETDFVKIFQALEVLEVKP